MARKGVEHKASETAVMAALHRTIAHKAYENKPFGPDHLAEYFLPPHFKFFMRFEKLRARIREKLNKFMPGLLEFMIARTAFFDQAFQDALNQKIPQIVLLGVGYDTRAYRFADLNKGTRIMELDIQTTQDRKLNCLKN